MIDLSKITIAKQGICLYAGCKDYGVIIEESGVRYGTGDYEDTPEIAGDINEVCFYVWFESLVNKGAYNVGGGCFLSLDDAKKHIESLAFIRWL